MICKICHGEEWVCEDHENIAWGSGDGCCGGAGAPCVCSRLHKDNWTPEQIARNKWCDEQNAKMKGNKIPSDDYE